MDLESVRAIAEPVVASLGLELVDVELTGRGRARTLRLTVDRPGGVDLDAIAEVSRPVSAALDEGGVVAGAYTLEVSSPGLERPLRRPADFTRFVGTTITLKTHEAREGARRHRGLLAEADGDGVTLEVDGRRLRFPYEAIASARTVFDWGPAPKPGSGTKPGGAKKKAKKAASKWRDGAEAGTAAPSEGRLA